MPIHTILSARPANRRSLPARLAGFTVAAVAAAALAAAPSVVHAGTIPFGTVLLGGSAWAGSSASLGDLNVYSNGLQNQDRLGTYGAQYECTELAQRWAHLAWGEPDTWPASSAADMYNVGPTLPVPLTQNPNGGAVPPAFGDIIVFGSTPSNTTGHVGVVASVTANSVAVVQENFTVNGTPTPEWTIAMSGTTVSSLGGLPVLGWLSHGAAPHVPVGTSSAPSVAVTPDGSTQTVFWRGANADLQEEWFAGGAWHGPADFAWSGSLAGEPSVAISKDGRTQTVFWQGPGGHLFEAWYANGWNGPADLTATWGGAGPLNSAPSAVSTQDGTQLVFWRGTDNHLWEAWYTNGRWYGPAEFSNAGSLAGAPTAIEMNNGSQQLVFWQSTDNRLYEAWYAAGRWNGPVRFEGTGPVQSTPTVSLTPDDSEQIVFWRGPANHLFESWYTGAWNGPMDLTDSAFGGVDPLSSSPSATVTTDGSTQVVFWQGPGNFVYEAWWAGGRWNGPVALVNG